MPPATAPQAKTPLRRDTTTLSKTLDSGRKSTSPEPIEQESTSKLKEIRHRGATKQTRRQKQSPNLKVNAIHSISNAASKTDAKTSSKGGGTQGKGLILGRRHEDGQTEKCGSP